ncbi:MAG: NUDIX-like domain-containing protein, partial [Perlucidibaca sp.]
MDMRYQPGVRHDGPVPGHAGIILFSGHRVLIDQDCPERFPAYAFVAPSLAADAELHYLGLLEGLPLFTTEVDQPFMADEPLGWVDLRRLLGILEEPLFQVAGRAAQLLAWARDHRYCGRCGHGLAAG